MKDKQLNNQTQKKQQNSAHSSGTPEPEFMNDIFCLFLKIVNFLSAIYIIFSLILYLIIHFHGKDLFKSKKSYVEYDRLLFLNLYYDIFLTFTIVVSYFAVYKKSILLYLVYWKLMILACVFGFYGYSQELSALNIKIKYIIMTVFVLNVLYAIYPIFHYLRKVQYFRVSLESFPADNIIHEVKLRTDMMKMGFNNIIIKIKLNKILPNITFKKEDYYFLSEECKNRSAYRPLSKDENDEGSNFNTLYGSKSTTDENNRNVLSMKST
jgi:hypothetical protein